MKNEDWWKTSWVREFMQLGDIITFGEDPMLHVVVMINDCAAKTVPLNKRDWQDPETKIDETEAGNRVSQNTSYGDYVKLVGRIHIHQIRRAQRLSSAQLEAKREKSETKTFVYLPRPGFAPPKKKIKKVAPTKTVITDDPLDFAPQVVFQKDSVETLLKAGSTNFVKFITSTSSQSGF